jgi:Fe-S cluster assembly ATPase SufC
MWYCRSFKGFLVVKKNVMKFFRYVRTKTCNLSETDSGLDIDALRIVANE